MDITLTTPSLLFPAITLLLLAYTNRFLSAATLIRNLHEKYKISPDDILISQIQSLKTRVVLIRDMQMFGVASFFLCVLCMLVLFFDKILLGEIIFGVSLVLLMASLGFSIREIQISVNSLDIDLSEFEKEE